ncbi:MAG: glycosyltransferase [Aphanothece sp. CMT-3BRIN-NPC111]|jgi:glycosyltransferase involved in cell wall biosynthesis|nr:glycosyltransferase [Aphanothece sp. CMT-3BRIN-NPC111]
MKSDQYFVSVIIPVYNGEKFLADAIASILKQNYYSLEIIIVDDGSTDGTAAVAAQFQKYIRYNYQSNQGPAAARNQGIKLARGNVIAFLDADDFWADNSLELQINCLLANPSVEIVQGLIQKIQLSSSATEKHLTYREIDSPYANVNLGSAVFRKSLFNKVGLFNESLNFSEDADWFIRAWEQEIVKVNLKQVTMFYRIHKDSLTKTKAPIHQGLPKLYKTYLDRRQRQDSWPATSVTRPTRFTEYMEMVPTFPTN